MTKSQARLFSWRNRAFTCHEGRLLDPEKFQGLYGVAGLLMVSPFSPIKVTESAAQNLRFLTWSLITQLPYLEYNILRSTSEKEGEEGGRQVRRLRFLVLTPAVMNDQERRPKAHPGSLPTNYILSLRLSSIPWSASDFESFYHSQSKAKLDCKGAADCLSLLRRLLKLTSCQRRLRSLPVTKEVLPENQWAVRVTGGSSAWGRICTTFTAETESIRKSHYNVRHVHNDFSSVETPSS